VSPSASSARLQFGAPPRCAEFGGSLRSTSPGKRGLVVPPALSASPAFKSPSALNGAVGGSRSISPSARAADDDGPPHGRIGARDGLRMMRAARKSGADLLADESEATSGVHAALLSGGHPGSDAQHERSQHAHKQPRRKGAAAAAAAAAAGEGQEEAEGAAPAAYSGTRKAGGGFAPASSDAAAGPRLTSRSSAWLVVVVLLVACALVVVLALVSPDRRAKAASAAEQSREWAAHTLAVAAPHVSLAEGSIASDRTAAILWYADDAADPEAEAIEFADLKPPPPPTLCLMAVVWGGFFWHVVSATSTSAAYALRLATVLVLTVSSLPRPP
jgi:hypothetical protein